MKPSKQSLLFILAFTPVHILHAQSDIKPNEISLEQKNIANDLAGKTTLTPIKLPDAQSMISLNQSGDGVINMPIVNVIGRKLSLPISISYVTNGIKVNQSSSEVGLGWSINIGSITRDYGAYEPDYTYTGSEFKMLDNGGSSHKKLKSTEWEPNPASVGMYTSPSVDVLDPIHQNKIMDYNNTTGMAPDHYITNVPGLGSNEFWNSRPESTTGEYPIFTFTENVPWKIDYFFKTYEVAQEVSRINEFTFSPQMSGTTPSTTTLNGNNNQAAAIALYPYVANKQFSKLITVPPSNGVSQDNLLEFLCPYCPDGVSKNPRLRVKYEDFDKFSIVIADGTRYVFGRSLRGQKYFFSEEPFWSAMKVTAGGTTSDFETVFNEFWKTDYIAEWLLTEVRSADYEDVNGDGIPSDGDKGDWIYIEYTPPWRAESVPGIAAAIPVPKHREFLNFTQTDRASSIWRERAYVTKITTPVQVVEFTTGERFDIEHDYFNKPFNRIENEYKYINKNVTAGASMPTVWHNPSSSSGVYEPIDLVDGTVKVNYPIDLRRYEKVYVKDKAGNMVQNISLNYAPKGSAQELAVSRYLILDNDKTTFNSYDPAALGTGLAAANFEKSVGNGRGKSTLLGIDYRGNSITSTNKLSYTFEYGYNPSYDEIHKYQIWKMAAFPTIRESLHSPSSRWSGTVKQRADGPPGTFVKIANNCSPYKTMYMRFTGEMQDDALGDNYGFAVYEDEMGYYYNASGPLDGRTAWCLSKINLPLGGNISLSYEKDATDINGDRIKWGGQDAVLDYCLPPVGHYNNVNHFRTLWQHVINLAHTGAGWPNDKLYKLSYEFYFLMNNNSGGLRVKELDITDNFGAPTIKKNYTYGTGHYTIPPADFLSNYMSAFGSFITNEVMRHCVDQSFSMWVEPQDWSDYNKTMTRLLTDVRIDKSVRDGAMHFYSDITETKLDGSKTKWYYGRLDNNMSNPNPSAIGDLKLKSGILKKLGGGSGIDNYQSISQVLTTNADNKYKIGNYKTEYIDNLSHVVQSEQTDYSFISFANSSISTNQVLMPTIDYYNYAVNGSLSSGSIVNLYRTVDMSGPSGVAHNLLENNFDFASTTYIKYNMFSTDPGTPIIPINTVMEAQYPFMKIGYNASNYNTSTMPAWFNPITLYTVPWSSPAEGTIVHDSHTHYIDWISDHDGHPRPIVRGWLADKQYYHPALTFQSHQSYRLQPSHSKTVKYFY